jgi:septum formation protein
LLTQIGVHFDTLAFRNPPREDAQIDETPLTGEQAIDYVQRVARAKAEHGWEMVEARKLVLQPVLAADTTLEFAGEIIGKPLNTDDALRILRRLSGQTHQVLTAVAVAFEGRIESALSVSEVTFGQLDEALLRHYALSGEPMDKAGAYGIQGYAALFVEHLTGSYSGVMGLPLFETGELLRRFDFPL